MSSNPPPPGGHGPQDYGNQPPGGYPPPEGYQPPAGFPPGSYYPPPGAQPPSGYPPPTEDPLVPVSFGDWWSKVLGVLARSWKSLLIIQLATVVPVLILVTLVGLAIGTGAVTGGPALVGPGMVAGLFLSVVVVAVALLAQGASVYVAVREAVGSPVQPGEALSFAAGRALPLLGWGVLAGIMTLIGFFLLILPGLYLLVVFGAALTGVIMFEHRGIGRAFELVNRRFWPTAGRLLSFMLAALVYNLVVDAILGAFLAQNSVVYQLLANILTVPLTLATVGVAIVAYAELRHHEEPRVTSHVLAGELRA